MSFNFGPPAGGSGLSFGAPNPTAALNSTFNFGGTTTTATSTPGSNLAFGATAAPALGAPAASTVPTLSFGAPSTTALNFSTTPSTAAPAFGSTFPTTLQTSMPTGGLLFSAKPAQTAAAPGFGFSAATTTKPAGVGFGLGTTVPATTTAVSTATVKIGLGGIDVNAAQPKATEGKTDSSKVKEMLLPQEIIATVDTLKAHFKQQKALSSDIVRASTTKLYNISSELNKLNWTLTEIHNNVDANYGAIKQLRADTTKAMQQAEIAQRTHDTLSGLQFENTAPLFYFMDSVRRFENEMLNLSKQVELTEKHMHSLTNPQSFTADDLKMGLQQIHECFIALAGRLQETHRLVETQNEQFLNLMKHREKKTTIVNVYEGAGNEFENASLLQRFHNTSRAIIPNASCGPTPFSTLVGGNQFGTGNFWSESSGTQTGIGGLGFTSGGGLFGSTGGDENYNLQKPPMGTKRNKH